MVCFWPINWNIPIWTIIIYPDFLVFVILQKNKIFDLFFKVRKWYQNDIILISTKLLTFYQQSYQHYPHFQHHNTKLSTLQYTVINIISHGIQYYIYFYLSYRLFHQSKLWIVNTISIFLCSDLLVYSQHAIQHPCNQVFFSYLQN